jgi:ribonuclease P protein component
MNQLRETFTKSERLCSRKAISQLFESSNSFFSYPFQVVWMKSTSEITFPAQVAFSVSKRGFKLAVTRNLIKRRIKEAYRKNKHLLYEFLRGDGSTIIFIIIFKGNSVPEYTEVEKSVREMLNKFITLLGDQPTKS